MTTHTLLALAALASLTTSLPDTGSLAQRAEPKPVDLAICLDTSGSMEGLINAARQNIWAIVNDLALAEPTPKLRIALLTFGNDGHSPQDGWVAVQTPLTDDLDLVSQKLFALTTNGGEEYVGRVLQKSLQALDWTPSNDALKLIVVAGNEAANQDPDVDFRAVCRDAISRDIMVNSIYCGNPGDQLAPVWREVAMLADGKFAAIDKDNGTVVIETPFDEQLAALSASLNETYLPFGAQGGRGAWNQLQQDENAGKLNKAAAAQRAATKSSSNYHCGWDLVDACKAGDVDLAAVKPEELPEVMRDMAPEERVAHVEKMGEEARRNPRRDQRDQPEAAELRRRGDAQAGGRPVQVVRVRCALRGARPGAGGRLRNRGADRATEVEWTRAGFGRRGQHPWHHASSW